MKTVSTKTLNVIAPYDREEAKAEHKRIIQAERDVIFEDYLGRKAFADIIEGIMKSASDCTPRFKLQVDAVSL